jgi:hypothetical protein
MSQRLCVPEIPSVLCGLRVFVDDTADQIAAPGSERVEVSDGAGHRLEWCGLPEGAVRPMLVVVDLVVPQHPLEMPVIPDQGAVEQFASASADPVPLEYWIERLTCAFSALWTR